MILFKYLYLRGGININTLIFLCAAGFCAAFVDSIAGGGGIISISSFLLAGLPPYLALGTNKFCACYSIFTSCVKFARSKKMDFHLLKFLVPFSLIGAILGVNTVLSINPSYVNTIVLVLLLFVAIYSLFSKTAGIEDNFIRFSMKNLLLGITMSLFLGFYDGFLGAGVGSFLIFGLIGIFGFDFVRSAGNSKALNFASNITSVFLFAFRGQINYRLGIPVALFMILGAKLGTRVALDKGVKIIKPIFVTMSLAVAVKMLYGIIK